MWGGKLPATNEKDPTLGSFFLRAQVTDSEVVVHGFVCISFRLLGKALLRSHGHYRPQMPTQI